MYLYGKPTTGFALNWSGKIQHWLHKIWAGLPIDGWSKFPWHRCNMQTLNTSWNLYCCFSRDKQHFVSFITYKQSFLLTFESTIDCSAFTMNFCLFFLPRFLLKTAFGKVFSVTLALQPIRSFGQIGVDFMSSMWYFCCCSSDANSTRNYCGSGAANSRLFFKL